MSWKFWRCILPVIVDHIGVIIVGTLRRPPTTYPTTYVQRSLTPVQGYVEGTSTFSALTLSGNSDSIGIFNPSTAVFSLIDISTVIAHDYKYIGGVLAPDGRIFFVPYNADSIGVFVLDEYLSTNATSAIADAMVRGVDLTDTSGASACTACVKRSLTPVQGYEEGTSTFSALTLPVSLTGRQDKFWGGVPNQAGSIGDFDPSTEALSLIDISSVIPSYWNYSSVITHDIKLFDGMLGGVPAPNGPIYFVPYYEADIHNRCRALYSMNSIGDFNPTTDAFSLISTMIPFTILGFFLSRLF
jgi:hypothetical protein